MNEESKSKVIKFEAYKGAEIEELETTDKFQVVYDIELTNKQAGQHWFDKASKRFFKCRFSQEVLFERFFISTEQDGTKPRLATIRMTRDNGTIQTVGQFQHYPTKTQAKKALIDMLNSGETLRGY